MEKKMNNKGFSLVELIIVVAIMAILIGILAPQYIKYVEKSRVSSDKATVQEFESALQVLASDPDADLAIAKSYKITFGTDGKVDWKASSDAKTALDKAGSVDTSKTYELKSSAFKDAGITITLKYDLPKGVTTGEKSWIVERTVAQGKTDPYAEVKEG